MEIISSTVTTIERKQIQGKKSTTREYTVKERCNNPRQRPSNLKVKIS